MRSNTARRRTAASRPASTGLIMLLTDDDNIRQVMAFPKTASGIDPMTEAPSTVDEKQLKELHVRVTGLDC